VAVPKAGNQNSGVVGQTFSKSEPPAPAPPQKSECAAPPDSMNTRPQKLCELNPGPPGERFAQAHGGTRTDAAPAGQGFPPEVLDRLRNAPIGEELRTQDQLDGFARDTWAQFERENPDLFRPEQMPGAPGRQGSLEDDGRVIKVWGNKDGASWMGYENAHRRAIEDSLGDRLGPDQRALVNRAQLAIDQDAFAEGRHTPLHAMQGLDQNGREHLSQERSQEVHRRWVEFNTKLAREDAKNGRYDRALAHYGFALHAVQDRTSPAHAEAAGDGVRFRPWQDGTGWGMTYKRHVDEEAGYPGRDSQLVRGTRALYRDVFEGVPMPKDIGVDRGDGHPGPPLQSRDPRTEPRGA
jgi:hypothetical protein